MEKEESLLATCIAKSCLLEAALQSRYSGKEG
jgi:hypothetical protein